MKYIDLFFHCFQFFPFSVRASPEGKSTTNFTGAS